MNKKNILVISQNIGRTSPGKVFEQFVECLYKLANVTLLCVNYWPTKKSNFESIEVIQISNPIFINESLTARLNRLTTKLFNISFRDYLINSYSPKLGVGKFNAIISLCSNNNLSPLIIADKLKNTDIPLIGYFVDASPVPSWWHPASDNNGVKKFVYKYTRKFDCIYSANPLMLEYQKKYINPSVREFGFIYPSSGEKKMEVQTKKKDITFLYTGSIYGIRTTDNLYIAFERVLKDYPMAKLVFIGQNGYSKKYIPDSIKTNTIFLPYSQDLAEWYSSATALIDIDGNVNYDIFLSGKVLEYLRVNRPIIAETGDVSPSRQLFNNIGSILLCRHDPDEIYKAFIATINTEYDYSDRDKVLEICSMSNAVTRLYNNLNYRARKRNIKV